MDTALLPLVFSVFAVAGAVKGVSGLGLPTVGIALLGLFLPLAEAAALLVVPALATNVWQAAGRGAVPLLRRLWPLLAGIVAGTGLGGVWLPDPALARLVLAEVLMLYAMLGLLDLLPRLPAGAEPWVGPVAGLATGVLTAFTGVFVLPAVPYLQALRLPRDQMVQALGLSFTVSTVALAALLAAQGHLAPGRLGLSLLATLPAVLGMLAGGRLRPRIPPVLFRRVFFALLFALAVHLLLA